MDWKMLEIALYQPDIAPNAATILRMCACFGLPCRIIEPAGFVMSDSQFRRAGMDYLDKAVNNTIDYVLMFVPNESISSFVHEADPQLIDTALEQKVVLCTPLTLYAFLVVIRQATDSFHTEQNAADIMRRINLFNKEWAKYTEAAPAPMSAAFHTALPAAVSATKGRSRRSQRGVLAAFWTEVTVAVARLRAAEALTLKPGPLIEVRLRVVVAG